VSQDRLQPSLSDYLDDRLDAQERERFEERLVADEELARQLATAREIRKELRGENEELSPGFYTRTVARFATEHRRLPFGATWSTIGLAAATIAAAAIFIPTVLREEIPEMPVAQRAQDEATRIPLDSRTDKDDLVAEKSIAAPKRKSRGAPAEALAQEDRERQTASGPPPSSKIAGTLPSAAEQPERLMATATELEESNFRSERGSALGDAAGNEISKKAEGIMVNEPADKARDFYDLELPSPVELPVDLVGLGEVEVLDARDVQQRLGAGRKKESKSAADPLASAESPPVTRFVAIGRRPGLHTCAALTVRRTDAAWEISYEGSGSSVGSVSCGIDIPDDGAEIRFQGWRVNE